jgi:hypothetical protein
MKATRGRKTKRSGRAEPDENGVARADWGPSKAPRKSGRTRKARVVCGEVCETKKLAAPEANPETWKCTRYAMPNGKCHHHGGNSVSHLDSHPGNVRTGLYVGAWHSDEERARYERYLGHEKLMDLTEAVAALGVLVDEAGRRKHERETPKFRARILANLLRWTELRESADHLAEEGEDARASEQAREARNLMAETIALARQGVSEDESSAELRELLVAQSERREHAWKIQLQAANVVTVSQLATVLRVVLLMIAEESGDPAVSERVAARIEKFMQGRADEGLSARQGIADAAARFEKG